MVKSVYTYIRLIDDCTCYAGKPEFDDVNIYNACIVRVQTLCTYRIKPEKRVGHNNK